MNFKKLSTMLLASVSLTALLNGCGSSGREGGGSPADVAKVDEATCAQCHGSAVSSVTAESIYAGYRKSSHFSNNVGCQGCHGGGAQHYGVGPIAYPKPDVSGRCVICHDQTFFSTHVPNHVFQRDVVNESGVAVKTPTYITAQSKCTNCHDPHDTKTNLDLGINAQWAESGHGDVTADPWSHYNYGTTNDMTGQTDPAKASNRDSCSRCHTATGFKNFLNNPTATATTAIGATPVWAFSASSDPAHEVLRCDACHVDYSFKRRVATTNGSYGALLPYAIPSGVLANDKIPNLGESNICANCHTGLASGYSSVTLKTASSFKNASSALSPGHYLAAAGTLLGINGFEGYSSNTTHARNYTAVSFAHNSIGLEDIGGIKDGVGPCAGCHTTGTTAANNDHSMKAVPLVTGTSGLTGQIDP